MRALPARPRNVDPAASGETLAKARPPSGAVREKIYLTYPRKLLKAIRTANISAEMGLVALELDGAEPEVRAAIRRLEELGIQVAPIAKNVIG